MSVVILGEGSELSGGRYVLECRLGAGGMATVWRALDTRLHRKVAIKLPSDAFSGDEAFAARFEREAQTAARLSHPNLVPVYDYGVEGDRPFLVSEYIDGASLAELREEGRPPATEELGRAVLDALAHIHAAGIVHRDVKPANILVDSGGRILMTDFGIALSAEATSLTATGKVIGTESYLAPEVMKGQRADARSDLYACGKVLSEGLSPEDPDRVHRLVANLTAADPAARPADAEEALAALVPVNHVVTGTTPVAGEPTQAFTPPDPPTESAPVVPPPGAPPRPRPPERVLESTRSREFPPPPQANRSAGGRRLWPLAVGLLLAALAAVALVVALSGGDDDGSGTGERAANAAKSKDGSRGSGAAAEEEEPADTVTETTTEEAKPEEAAPTSGTVDPAQGAALTNEAYALLQAGDAEGALPLAEEAVSLFSSDTTDVNYGYALFNYAQALRLTGDPEAAIPLLEQRLAQFPEEQVAEVEAELELARQEAEGG